MPGFVINPILLQYNVKRSDSYIGTLSFMGVGNNRLMCLGFFTSIFQPFGQVNCRNSECKTKILDELS